MVYDVVSFPRPFINLISRTVFFFSGSIEKRNDTIYPPYSVLTMLCSIISSNNLYRYFLMCVRVLLVIFSNVGKQLISIC